MFWARFSGVFCKYAKICFLLKCHETLVNTRQKYENFLFWVNIYENMCNWLLNYVKQKLFYKQLSKTTLCRTDFNCLCWWANMPQKKHVARTIRKWLKNSVSHVLYVHSYNALCLTMLLWSQRATLELTWKAWVSSCECPRMLSNSVECFTSCAVVAKTH